MSLCKISIKLPPVVILLSIIFLKLWTLFQATGKMAIKNIILYLTTIQNDFKLKY